MLLKLPNVTFHENRLTDFELFGSYREMALLGVADGILK
jgi:hypothetical protein